MYGDPQKRMAQQETTSSADNQLTLISRSKHVNFRKLTSFSAHYILSGQHQCSQKHVPENLGNKREVQFLFQ